MMTEFLLCVIGVLVIVLFSMVQRLKWRLKDLQRDVTHRDDFQQIMHNVFPWDAIDVRIAAAMAKHEHGHFEKCQQAARLQIGLARFEVKAVLCGSEDDEIRLRQFIALDVKDKFRFRGSDYRKEDSRLAVTLLNDGTEGATIAFDQDVQVQPYR